MRIPSLLYGTGVSHTYTLFLGTTHGLSAMYYATGEKYFDFLTRDGLWKTAPRTLYFDPFELTIWIAVLATSFCLILILVATQFYSDPAFSDSTGNEKTKATISATFTFKLYSISVLLENNLRKLNFPTFGKKRYELGARAPCVQMYHIWKPV